MSLFYPSFAKNILIGTSSCHCLVGVMFEISPLYNPLSVLWILHRFTIATTLRTLFSVCGKCNSLQSLALKVSLKLNEINQFVMFVQLMFDYFWLFWLTHLAPPKNVPLCKLQPLFVLPRPLYKRFRSCTRNSFWICTKSTANVCVTKMFIKLV